MPLGPSTACDAVAEEGRRIPGVRRLGKEEGRIPSTCGERERTARPWFQQLPIQRPRFAKLWDDLPSLTMLATTPGWGKTTWMRQCADHLAPEKATWVRSVVELRRMHAECDSQPENGLLFIDGLEADLSVDPMLWDLVLGLAANTGNRIVVSCYDVPSRVRAEALVLDERNLAFDDRARIALLELLHAGNLGLDMFVFPESMRGCPWIIGRDLSRFHRGADDRSWIASELDPDSLFYKDLRARTEFLQSGIGRALIAVGGLPKFTEALLGAVDPDAEGTDFFARMSAWPIFEMAVDDEFGEDALEWTPAAWRTMSVVCFAEEHQDALRAGLRAERDRESVIGEVRSLLLLGRYAEAEEIAEHELRRLLMFASHRLVATGAPEVSDPVRYPALALLHVELHTRDQGNSEAMKSIAISAARSLAGRTSPSLLGELERSATVSFGAVSGGDRVLAGRFLAHFLELTDALYRAQATLSVRDRRRVTGQLYLAYWAATQLDRHEVAGALVNLMAEIGAGSDRLALQGRICARTEADLAGTTSMAGSRPPKASDPMSYAVAFRDIEDGDDMTAISRLRVVMNHPNPPPSRSVTDGLVLVVRAICAPDELPVSDVDACLDRSRALWGGVASSFVSWGAMVAYATLGAESKARSCNEQLEADGVFTGLGHVIWHQWQGDHEAAVAAIDTLLERPLMPRFEVMALVLQAASFHCREETKVAVRTLQIAWQLHRAPRLLRFAFRFIPADVAAELISAAAEVPGELADVLGASLGDPRYVKWTKRPSLTPSELEILGLLRRGLSNAEIAAQRYVVVGTLRNQLKSIYRKLHVANRHEAVEAAYRLGVFTRAKGE